jgi:hypothetical protein
MYTQYQDTDAGVSEISDLAEIEWYAFDDAADVPESPGAWTLKDFADILPDVDIWR